jgi:hypothetical protein
LRPVQRGRNKSMFQLRGFAPSRETEPKLNIT